MAHVLMNGLLMGGIDALVAIGLSMIFGGMKIVNFAQGEFLMVGMFISWSMAPIISKSKNPYLLIIPIARIMFVFGVIVFRVVIKPIIGRDSSNFIILTLGLSYLLQNIVQLIYGPDYRAMPVTKELKYGVFELGDVVVIKTRLFAFLIALVFVALVFWFLNKTSLGRAMRSTAESIEIAKTLGVNTLRTYMIAFSLGAVFAGIAGLLITPIYFVYPLVGVPFSAIATCCVILGGLGNITGALVGGLLIGLLESYVATYISLDLAPVAIHLLLIVILVFKPSGIFGKGMRKA